MRKVLSSFLLSMILLSQFQVLSVYAQEQAELQSERQEAITTLDAVDTLIDSTVDSLDAKIKHTSTKQKLQKKHKEIEAYIEETQEAIQTESSSEEIVQAVEKVKKVAVLKVVAGVTPTENLEDTIDAAIAQTQSEKKEALETIQESLETPSGDYSIIVKTEYSLTKTQELFAKFDDTTTISFLYETNSENYFEVFLREDSIFRQEMLEDIESGILPESFLGIQIVLPEVFSIFSRDIAGEDLSQTWGIERYKTYNFLPETSESGVNISVGVVDTGIDYSHPDLQNVNITTDKDFVNEDNDAMDDQGHGTHVAGTIAANINGSGILGVNPDVDLVPLKICTSSGFCPSYAVIRAVEYASEQDIDILNMSLWGRGNPVGHAICDAISAYSQNWGLVIAAAGNANIDTNEFIPGGCSDALAVAAIDQNNHRASFSNYGNKIDVAAPGVDIYSTYPTNKGNYKKLSGTSMAAPHITGLVSLMLAEEGNMTLSQVKNKLQSYPQDVTTDVTDKTIASAVDVEALLASYGVSSEEEVVEEEIAQEETTEEISAQEEIEEENNTELPVFKKPLIDFGDIEEILGVNSGDIQTEVIDIDEQVEEKKYFMPEEGEKVYNETGEKIENPSEIASDEVFVPATQLEGEVQASDIPASEFNQEEDGEVNTIKKLYIDGAQEVIGTNNVESGTLEILNVEMEETLSGSGVVIIEEDMGIQSTLQADENGRIGYFDFNGNAQDSSVNNNHGTVYGVTPAIGRDGVESSAYHFDGSNDYILLPRELNISESTTCFYYKTAQTSPIISLQNGGMVSFTLETGRVAMWNGAYYALNYSLPTDNQFHHLCMTRSANTIKVHLDGTSLGTAVFPYYYLNNSIQVGKYGSGYFLWIIDDLSVYNRALNDQEILDLYIQWEDNLSWNDSSLIAHYDFNGSVNDISENWNDGVLYGPVLSTWRNGEENTAYSFDGINDYIQLNPISLSSQATFSTWIQFDPTNPTSAFLSKRNGAGTNDFQLYANSAWRLRGLFWNSSWNAIHDYYTTFDADTWYHIVYVYENPWFAKLYINGVKTGADKTVSSNMNNRNINLRIGDDFYNGFFKWKIDELSIYNRALNDQEILDLYSQWEDISQPEEETSWPEASNGIYISELTSSQSQIDHTNFSNIDFNIIWKYSGDNLNNLKYQYSYDDMNYTDLPLPEIIEITSEGTSVIEELFYDIENDMQTLWTEPEEDFEYIDNGVISNYENKNEDLGLSIQNAHTIFQDDMSDGVLDSFYAVNNNGRSVESGGYIQSNQAVTDQASYLITEGVEFWSDGWVIEYDFYSHPNGNYFYWGIALAWEWELWDEVIYNASHYYTAYYDGANRALKNTIEVLARSRKSENYQKFVDLPGIHNQWVKHKIELDYVNNKIIHTVNQQMYEIDIDLSYWKDKKIKMYINPYGWFTGHYVRLDNLKIENREPLLLEPVDLEYNFSLDTTDQSDGEINIFVKATDGVLESNIGEIQFFKDTNPLHAPTDFSVEFINNEDTTYTWTDNSHAPDNEDKYVIRDENDVLIADNIPADTTEYTEVGLARETSYQRKVCASGVEGEECSELLQFTTPKEAAVHDISFYETKKYDIWNFQIQDTYTLSTPGIVQVQWTSSYGRELIGLQAWETILYLKDWKWELYKIFNITVIPAPTPIVYDFDLIIGQSWQVVIPGKISDYSFSMSDDTPFSDHDNDIIFEIINDNTFSFRVYRAGESKITLRDTRNFVIYEINVRVEIKEKDFTIILWEERDPWLKEQDSHRSSDENIVYISGKEEIFAKNIGIADVESRDGGIHEQTIHVTVIPIPDPIEINCTIYPWETCRFETPHGWVSYTTSRPEAFEIDYGSKTIRAKGLASGTATVYAKSRYGDHMTHVMHVTVILPPPQEFNCSAPVWLECQTKWYDNEWIYSVTSTDTSIVNVRLERYSQAFADGPRDMERILITGVSEWTADIYIYKHGDHTATVHMTITPPVPSFHVADHSVTIHQWETVHIDITQGGWSYRAEEYDDTIVYADADTNLDNLTGDVDITGREPGTTEILLQDYYYQEEAIQVTVLDTILDLVQEELTVSGDNYEYIVAREAHTAIKRVETDNDHATAQVITLPDGEVVVKVSANTVGTTIVTVFDHEENSDSVVVTVGSWGSENSSDIIIEVWNAEELLNELFLEINLSPSNYKQNEIIEINRYIDSRNENAFDKLREIYKEKYPEKNDTAIENILDQIHLIIFQAFDEYTADEAWEIYRILDILEDRYEWDEKAQAFIIIMRHALIQRVSTYNYNNPQAVDVTKHLRVYSELPNHHQQEFMDWLQDTLTLNGLYEAAASLAVWSWLKVIVTTIIGNIKDKYGLIVFWKILSKWVPYVGWGLFFTWVASAWEENVDYARYCANDLDFTYEGKWPLYYCGKIFINGILVAWGLAITKVNRIWAYSKVTEILEDVEVKKTLDRINAWTWKYSQDWTIFANDGRWGWERLPIKWDNYYTEWTVDTPWLDHRWLKRIIVWNDGEKYYTDDHYSTFLRIK